jgi:hypothetical protein
MLPPNYENSLITLCMHVLAFFEKLYQKSGYNRLGANIAIRYE